MLSRTTGTEVTPFTDLTPTDKVCGGANSNSRHIKRRVQESIDVLAMILDRTVEANAVIYDRSHLQSYTQSQLRAGRAKVMYVAGRHHYAYQPFKNRRVPCGW